MLFATKAKEHISTVKLRDIEFVFEEVFRGIKRNGLLAFASISTIALSLGVLGAFMLMALSANNFTKSQINRFEIAVFIKDMEIDKVNAVASQIKSMKNVQSAVMRDRDKEWAVFKREHPDIESAGLPLNVLPYALDVRVSDQSKLASIANKIRAIDGVDKVQDGRETMGRVMTLARVLKALSIIGVIILLITTAFIISNAIKLTLYARRREIRIMQLVGATNQFIRLPLVFEGVAFGAIGAIVAWVLLVCGASYILHVGKNITRLVGGISSGLSDSQLAILLVMLGIIIGAAGSFVSIRRFLRD